MPTSLRHLILGLLTQRPMSGYDIKRVLKSLDWLVGNPSFGSLYPALHALLKDKLVSVEVFAQQDKPSRKVYTITDAGREVLQEWVDRPISAGVSLKTFVMRLILADNLSPTNLVAQLNQRREQVSGNRANLEQAVQLLDTDREMKRHLALDYGLALATAELAWLDGVLSRLSQQSMPVEVVQSD